MILVSRSYSEVTEESAVDGETSEAGMLAENEEFTFKELVRLFRDYPEASCYPTRGNTGEWYSTGYVDMWDGEGTQREECVHFSRDNHPRSEKYWRLAAIAAGIVRS